MFASMLSRFRTSTSTMIDIIVPVYNAPDDVARCIASVLRHTKDDDYRLILINDASTDPAVTDVLKKFESEPQIVVLHNEKNMGFTATANRGLQLSKNDVVLLNSDTEVSKGWLAALRRCAESDAGIGTITPFSNNAEICSYPEFCVNTPWPESCDTEPVRAALARAAIPSYPEIPTGVGFCFFIRRRLINVIGVFDMAFGAGYGEENDFCMRAQKAGFKNVLCDNAFVVHTGGRSFVGRKIEQSMRNMPLLMARHPEYEDKVLRYIALDPVKPIREMAILEEMKAKYPEYGVLHILHGDGGGTESYARQLMAHSPKDWRHYLAIADDDIWRIEFYAQHEKNVSILTLVRQQGESWSAFIGSICATLAITLIHVHNIFGSRKGIIETLPKLGIPYGYTVHDLSFGCPTITFLDPKTRYCGGQTDDTVCARCLAQQPDFAHIDITYWRAQHRALVADARFVIAPSQWAAEMFNRYFPDVEVMVIAHGTSGEQRTPRGLSVIYLSGDDVPTVAVLGAVGPDKGARRLERLVELARAQKANIRFVLIGYLDKERGPWQSDDSRFLITNRYDPRDMAMLFKYYRARVVLYPSAGPETFSYTLSEAWRAGLPAFVPPIGALAERMKAYPAGWIMSEEEWQSEEKMLERLLTLISDQAENELAQKAMLASGAPRMSLSEMAVQTFAIYTQTMEAYPATIKTTLPFSGRRIRDGLGYRPWHAIQRVDEPLLLRAVRFGVRLKKTPFGKALYGLVPRSLINMLLNRV